MPARFYLYPVANKHGEFPIRVALSVGATRYMTGIGYNCTRDAWNDGHGIKARYINSKGVSAKIINAVIAKIQSHFDEYEVSLKAIPTQKELKRQYEIAINKEEEASASSKTIFEHLREFVSEQSVSCQWAATTILCWQTFAHHLKAFGRKITYNDFNEEGVNRFINFLRVKQCLEEKTVKNQYNNLKWFINWAIRKGYCQEEYINKHKPKFKVLTKPVIFLTKEELLKLYKFKIPADGSTVTLYDLSGNTYEKTVHNSESLAKTRDLFCFCAFTGLRYSDMAKVKRSDIIGDTLYVTTQKTNDRLPIDLNSFSKAILSKYRKNKFPEGLALPVISNQQMNYHIKDICELCGFNTPITSVFYKAGLKVEETRPKWELIGTHAGRRTFICFALSSGIPPEVVMKWTGHSDYKAMKPYIDIAEKTKAAAMSLFDQNLKK